METNTNLIRAFGIKTLDGRVRIISCCSTMASEKCPTCNAEPAVPANDNHLLLSGVTRQDLSLSEDLGDPDHLIWRRRKESFRLALIKNADETLPLLNRVAGPGSRLHLDPAHNEGYYLFGKSLSDVRESICDGYRWNNPEIISEGANFYVALGDTPIHRIETVVPNPCFYVEDRVPQLVGCCILHVRYSHEDVDPDVHPPAIEGIVLNPRWALEDISKFDPDRPSHCDELPELHLRSVLGCYWDFTDAYTRHALPGSTYLVDGPAFRRWTMATIYQFFPIGDTPRYGGQNFESTDPTTVAGLVGFVLAPYCRVVARIVPLKSKARTFRKLLKNPAAAKLSYVQFGARCVKCVSNACFVNIHDLIHHLSLCFDVDFVALLYSRNCPK